MLKVRDIMTQEVIAIQDTATVAQAIALMQYHKVRSLIIEHPEGQTAYGIITERDIVYRVMAVGKDPHEIGVQELVREPCITAHPDLTVEEMAQLFAAAGIQRAPVIDGQQLLGIISVTDLVMKTDGKQNYQADWLALQVENALKHARIICGDPQTQISKECSVAWDVVEAFEDQAALNGAI
ncbi:MULTISPECIES: CBS domain-containing protein [Acaryochloris]|uniref:CBS domain containing membrane protein, putative n=1 Tax=Acaryochloris marina (strain MBIC 11017) TaxID=329726 RepID=A8ZNU3_ACAM1|nr:MULTISPECIES: CBS domain-containing protein [Acaryochloris]ABW32679.1 CBS domain containing membrane protein, putative [Acaryochloris marina MBIC11017]KAI9129685.1 CBS domain-containing protein [Acaryochloris sp. CCMEE 5410]